MKEQEKSTPPPKKKTKEREISNLPDEDFKEIVIKMLTKLESGLEEFRRSSTKRKSKNKQT